MRRGGITRRTAIAALGAVAVLPFAPTAHAGHCRSETFEGDRYTVCVFDPSSGLLRLFWGDDAGRPYRTFSALSSALEASGAELVFAINGGMFQADFKPVGLHVEDGRELRPLNRRPAPDIRPVPNFYKMPNGVFYLDRDGGAGVVTTERYASSAPDALHATQSGPMLVIDGALHGAFIEGSRDRTRRSGVGVTPAGEVVFAISDGQVNFHDFARLFRDRLGCPNALFLDGGRGTGIYSPELGRNDWSWHGGFGPMIGIVIRR